MRLGRWAPLVALCVPALVSAQSATPSPRVVEFRFTPTARAQIALWLEKTDGTFAKTFFLTQAVGWRGIGNRPGASGMNSGFHWPYGRREGVLPIWAHRRAAAPGAAQFNRVIFQNRLSEGFASRTSEDSTAESYFCLSFNNATTKKDALDAVSCASGFNSDKGRFIKPADVTGGYNEPADVDFRPLDMVSLYPPRRDVNRCAMAGCADTPDVSSYADHARQVMPDIDSVTMATPVAGDQEQSFLFPVPTDLPDGDYRAWAEVNTEGDSNASFDLPTTRLRVQHRQGAVGAAERQVRHGLDRVVQPLARRDRERRDSAAVSREPRTGRTVREGHEFVVQFTVRRATPPRSAPASRAARCSC